MRNHRHDEPLFVLSMQTFDCGSNEPGKAAGSGHRGSAPSPFAVGNSLLIDYEREKLNVRRL
jgi:hypothetical protein